MNNTFHRLKNTVFLIWVSFSVLHILSSALSILTGSHEFSYARARVALIAAFLVWIPLHRVYRRFLNRCPACKERGIFHGWKTTKHYRQSDPPVEVRAGPDEMFFTYDRVCRECHEPFQAKLPETKAPVVHWPLTLFIHPHHRV